MRTISALWRRLDLPGHDACRFAQRGAGWEIEGTAIFRGAGGATSLTYRVSCDSAWRTQQAAVRGFVGDEGVEASIERCADGTWLVAGRPVPGLAGCEQIDFGFTPATNFTQLRALDLAVGRSAELMVACMDVPPSSLRVLSQRYERRDVRTSWYEPPTVGYAGLLELTDEGLVRVYPGLWELEREDTARPGV